MKPLLFALRVVFVCGGLSAQTPAWQPSPGHTQVPIWPGAVPDPQPVAGPGGESLVANRPWWAWWVYCVPRISAYDDGVFARGKEYGRCCGGVSWRGYEDLAIDLEGTEICDWLVSKGIPVYC